MLVNLKNKYENQKAIVIMGGPSILKNNLDLSVLNDRADIIFIEPKTLTKKFLEFGLKPDFIFATYPEKLRTNTMQYTFIQAISCGYDLESSLKKEFVNDWLNFVDNFGEYAEINRIRFPHKKYKIKREVVLKNSPYDLLASQPDINIIANQFALDRDGYKFLDLPNKLYTFDIDSQTVSKESNLETYLNPKIINQRIEVKSIDSMNSATIGMIPILNFLGFKQVCFIGKDMSMLGAMEYSGEYIFKSMKHYKKFHNASRKAFSYTFPKGFNIGLLSYIKNSLLGLYDNNKKEMKQYLLINKLLNDVLGLKGRFMRERVQFNDYKVIGEKSSIEFINIYKPTKYAQPVPGMKNINFDSFLKNF